MGVKKTKEDFIVKARVVHGDKYDYSLVEYKGEKIKVCIICPIHGEFWQTPDAHVNGKCGCRKCANEKISERQKDSLDEFLKKAKEKHGDKYDYSRVNYVNSSTKVCIICPIHGEFWQTPSNHLMGKGCLKCAQEYVISKKRINKDDFVERANIVHNFKYDYSKVNYVNTKTKVCIICPEHGEFWQRASAHLMGRGCPKCGRKITGDILRGDIESFIKKGIEKFGGKFGYNHAIYLSVTSPITITCYKHGDFETTPNAFLSQKYGCPKCALEHTTASRLMTKEEFISKAIEIHGDSYDYNLVEYTGCDNNVKIICPEHGIFEQTPYRHLRGAKCPNCESSHGETFIRRFLNNNNVKFLQQYHISIEQKLFSRNNLRVDFYLPDCNTIIEFHGIQHYKEIPFFHRDDDAFARQVDRDKRLRQYCKQHKIKLIEIKYDQIDKIDKILDKKLKLNNKH